MQIRKVITVGMADCIEYHFTTIHNGKKIRTGYWCIPFGDGHDNYYPGG